MKIARKMFLTQKILIKQKEPTFLSEEGGPIFIDKEWTIRAVQSDLG
jgi:hypothetical protein